MKSFFLHIIPLLSFLLLLLSACHEIEIIIDSPEKATFMDDEVVGLYIDGERTFTYNEFNHQLVYNKKRNLYRIQDDAQNQFLNFHAETAPKSIGVKILCEILFYTEEEYALSMNLLFECTRMDEEKIWFWNSDEKIGVVLMRLQ